MAATKRGSIEYLEQLTLFQWAEKKTRQYPELEFMFSTLNGVRLPIGLAMKCKKSGMKSGVFDIILPVSRCGYHQLWIEMKAGKNKLSENQERYKVFLTKENVLCRTAYSSLEASAIIEDYLCGRVDQRALVA